MTTILKQAKFSERLNGLPQPFLAHRESKIILKISRHWTKI